MVRLLPNFSPNKAALLVISGLLVLVVGCSSQGVPMQTWWGPLAVDDEGPADFGDGGTLQVRAFAHRMTLSTADYLSVAFVAGEQPASCTLYSDYLRQLWDVQGFVASMLAQDAGERPPADEWYAYTCQAIGGAARGAFGGDGRYRALHLLLDVTGMEGVESGYTFGPSCSLGRDDDGNCLGQPANTFVGAEVLGPGEAVVRLYERAKHGAKLLPDGGVGAWTGQDLDPVEQCASLLEAAVADSESGEDDIYPDAQSTAMRVAAHVYYHQWAAPNELAVGGGSELPGLSLGDWEAAGSVGTEAQPTIFAATSRAPEIFPYSQVLLSTLGKPVDAVACPDLDPYAALLWPEIPGFFEFAASTDFDDAEGGDDDDSGAD